MMNEEILSLYIGLFTVILIVIIIGLLKAEQVAFAILLAVAVLLNLNLLRK